MMIHHDFYMITNSNKICMFALVTMIFTKNADHVTFGIFQLMKQKN